MRIKLIIILTLLICVVHLTSSAQKPEKKISISGTVTDPDKNPLPGVQILIDNKKTDCETNKKGNYKLKVSSLAKNITAFSMMNGMKEVPIAGKTVINFELYPESATPVIEQKKEKDETVEVGYGTEKKKELTTHVSRIDGQNPKYASYSNIYDMIRNEVPGVRVAGNSIYLVEPTSVNSSNEPLLVVDGVPVSSIDDIQPTMVKSIEVLKGAAASIYGSRGSNGVILISLMKGAKKK
ncbi:MAG: TonB-dependent receptor plug domain-containing protein [Bacteroidales bacterium]|jgi:TonB-dependent SusC/RagA subfamily outer membrane receptor